MMEEPPKNEILRLPAMVGRGAAKKLYHNEIGEGGFQMMGEEARAGFDDFFPARGRVFIRRF
jgi:hypothetical protein